MCWVIRQSYKRTNKSCHWTPGAKSLIWQGKHGLYKQLRTFIDLTFLIFTLVLGSRIRRTCGRSADWTDVLFIRGEILSPAATCDSNWSSVVPGTYWDIWIYRVGRWMAKIHDHAMRGEREKAWGAETIWEEWKKRNARLEEKKGMESAKWWWWWWWEGGGGQFSTKGMKNYRTLMKSLEHVGRLGSWDNGDVTGADGSWCSHEDFWVKGG